MLKNALDNTIEEWSVILKNEYNMPSFRAKQIFEWLHKGADFDEMNNLPLHLRQLLKQDYTANGVIIYKYLESNKDRTRKYLFQLKDGNIIEGVLMNYKYGNTICISTQVGCRMNCAFCASGLDGLIRNLSAGEILGQVIAVNKDMGGAIDRQITNIVLMGSGEPLDNYDNTIKFLRLVNYESGINVGKRNISLSTCGLVDRINDLILEDFPITLTISLHASNDELRSKLMPIANKWSLRDLIKSCKNYFNKTGRRIIFEYAMIDGVNDNVTDAIELASLLRGFPCHVNVIGLNRVPEKNLRGSSKDRIQRFIDSLEDNHISVTLRRTMGGDIEGACGQLRRKELTDQTEDD